MLETTGFSSQLSVDGRVIYLEADIEALVRSLRVVSKLVATMKRAAPSFGHHLMAGNRGRTLL